MPRKQITKQSPVEKAADRYASAYDLRIGFLAGKHGWSAAMGEKLERAHRALYRAVLAARRQRKGIRNAT